MKFVIYFFFLLNVVYAKELLLPKHIYQYLNQGNPFYYQAIGEQYVAKGREYFYEGALDTQLNAKYDNKNYPTTTGTYEEIALVKPLANGIALSMGYRKAKGTQEYNNIKTGKDGEYISSIKIPLFSVLYDISKNKVDIQTAQISTRQAAHKSDLNLLKLYFNVSKIYYQLLLQKALVRTQKELLAKAKKRRTFINKQIKVGNIPAVMNIEIEQIIIHREQQILYEKNNYEIVKNIFLQYLGIPAATFSKRFTIPRLKMTTKSLRKVEESLSIAIANRPDLKMLDSEIEQLVLKKSYNDVAQYPKFDMKFSALYDPLNQEGYKVSFNVSVPLERRQYRGMDEVLQKQNLMKQSEKLKAIRELETSIKNIYQKIKTKKKALIFSKKELRFVRKLESVEMKKMREGVGNVMFLNQREIAVIKVEQKRLKDYYDLEIYFLEVDYLLGKFAS